MITRLADCANQAQACNLDTVRRFLAHSLGAGRLWIGLAESPCQTRNLAGIQPLEDILALLPPERRQAARLGQEGFLCAGEPEPAAPELMEAGGYWCSAQLTLPGGEPGLLLAGGAQPFQLETVREQAWLVSLALERCLIGKQATHYQAALDALGMISRRISSHLKLSEVLDLLVESTLEILPADVCHIYTTAPLPGEHGEARFQFLTALWRDGRRIPAVDEPRPDGLTAAVARQRQAIVINNARRHPFYQGEHASQWGIESIAGYPLMRKDQVKGVFTVSFMCPHVFTPEELYILALLADQAAVAIENAQGTHHLNQALSEMTMLYDLSQKLSETLKLDEVLALVVNSIKSLFSSHAVTIFLLDATGGLRLAATDGLSREAIQKAVFKPGQGIGGQVVLSGKPFYAPDTRQDERYPPLDPAMRSSLAVPLMAKGRVIGALTVDSQAPHDFSPETERLLAIAAASAAIAIDNAHLFENERRRANELNTIIELSRTITQHLDIEQVFTAAHKAIERLMPSDAFFFSLRDRQARDMLSVTLIDKGVRYPPAFWPLDAGLSGYVIRSGKPLLVNDLEDEPVPFHAIPFGEKEPVHSVLATPLVFGRDTIGMVCTQSYQTGAYDEHALHLLEAIADHIAVAVENANMFSDLQKRFLGLQELEQVRVEFIQNISHELRTPLTFLRAYVDLLLDNELGALNDHQRQSLRIVKEKTATLVSLVEDITTLEAHNPDWLAVEPVDLPALASAAIEEARLRPGGQAARFILHAPSNLPPVPADAERLNQVFEHLLQNACKFGAPQGPIEVKIEKLSSYVQVAIQDKGRGIPKQYHDKIFDRFYQVDGSLSRPHGGLGLGLALVKHIIEAHDGRTWVESEEGRGSTFFFTLPVIQTTESKH